MMFRIVSKAFPFSHTLISMYIMQGISDTKVNKTQPVSEKLIFSRKELETEFYFQTLIGFMKR